MTLDEAIIHAEKAAERNEEYATIHAHGDEFEQEDAFKCEECAKEHRQLAEWLKDYKRLLEQEPCEDCVSRQAVLDMMQMRMGAKELYRAVYDLPSVTPAEKMGHWVAIDEEPHEDWECDRCGHIEYADEDLPDKYHFCPNCGVKMEAEE